MLFCLFLLYAYWRIQIANIVESKKTRTTITPLDQRVGIQIEQIYFSTFPLNMWTIDFHGSFIYHIYDWISYSTYVCMCYYVVFNLVVSSFSLQVFPHPQVETSLFTVTWKIRYFFLSSKYISKALNTWITMLTLSHTFQIEFRV